MTTTRTQAGKTPKQSRHDGYVETPGTFGRRRSRKSVTSKAVDSYVDDSSTDTKTGSPDAPSTVAKKQGQRVTRARKQERVNGHANGHANGSANGSANGVAHVKGLEHSDTEANDQDKPTSTELGSPASNGTTLSKDAAGSNVDLSSHIEFGGSVGVTALMVGFPLLMYYMWIGAYYYDGKAPWPRENESWIEFFHQLGGLVYTGAYPSLKAWAMYWGFLIFEGACYCLMPGIWTKGKPLPHEGGKQLDYYCSAVWSWWSTIALAIALHLTGIFKLYTIVDEFGPIMSVAIISGFLVSIVAYVSAIYRGRQHRMTGYLLYDFFMGAELNPRLFGILDFKMFFEVRLPWFILFLTTLGTAARQYERYGYVSGEVGLLVLAHFLYANACSKGEELIVPTWDMYYEKWGFMLIFWNLAGVPLSYCHCTLYLANHDPSTYVWNKYALGALYLAYIFVYWVWDTTNSQKNRFRAQESGNLNWERKTFPQLPWQTVKNPNVIRTEDGLTILADGWYGYARKIHYTCDLFFALSWGAVTGLNSPFPWFYPLFFSAMIIHRASRDIERCRKKYGKAWEEYERQVPYLFIPIDPEMADQPLGITAYGGVNHSAISLSVGSEPTAGDLASSPASPTSYPVVQKSPSLTIAAIPDPSVQGQDEETAPSVNASDTTPQPTATGDDQTVTSVTFRLTTEFNPSTTIVRVASTTVGVSGEGPASTGSSAVETAGSSTWQVALVPSASASINGGGTVVSSEAGSQKSSPLFHNFADTQTALASTSANEEASTGGTSVLMPMSVVQTMSEQEPAATLLSVHDMASDTGGGDNAMASSSVAWNPKSTTLEVWTTSQYSHSSTMSTVPAAVHNSTSAASATSSTGPHSPSLSSGVKVVAIVVPIVVSLVAAIALGAWYWRRKAKKPKLRIIHTQQPADWLEPGYTDRIRAQMMGMDLDKVGPVPPLPTRSPSRAGNAIANHGHPKGTPAAGAASMSAVTRAGYDGIFELVNGPPMGTETWRVFRGTNEIVAGRERSEIPTKPSVTERLASCLGAMKTDVRKAVA
ncbi:hypothetical protein DV735_g4617, partial [Chaetothyriales sp. CBS 134920]